jgi:hypothetical protein
MTGMVGTDRAEDCGDTVSLAAGLGAAIREAVQRMHKICERGFDLSFSHREKVAQSAG